MAGTGFYNYICFCIAITIFRPVIISLVVQGKPEGLSSSFLCAHVDSTMNYAVEHEVKNVEKRLLVADWQWRCFCSDM